MGSPEENESYGAGLCRQNIETLLAAVAQTQAFDDEEAATTAACERTGGNDNCEPSTSGVNRDGDEQQLAGASPEIDGDVLGQQPFPVVLSLPAKGQQVIASGHKRRRRRQVKRVEAEAKPMPPPPPLKREKREEDEEDVCFICFDGGSLVLCDRRNCPKAYHPACIKRDEAFFSSKAVWNCGWHICNLCTKPSHYMCYTCTYSLCKGCTKDADYVCVRGNKGFCATCMKIILLIEKKDLPNSESVQVDFDDKTSWEYLFKVYWVCLKEKLSLTISELTQAKKPCKDVASATRKRRLSGLDLNGHGKRVSMSHRSSEQFELNKPQEPHGLVSKDPSRIENSSIDKELKTSSGKGANVVSQNAEKPITDNGAEQPSIRRSSETSNVDIGMHRPILNWGTEWMSKDHMQERPPQKNLDEYAAVDSHNISLIYLQRNLMETLIGDKEKFHDVVVGSIIRIRIPSNDHRDEFYRLVQVVGTGKGAEQKIGCQTADVMLEVLNFDKREFLSVDSVSDQEFTEDECRQLRQNISCGHGKPLTIGDMQKKAIALQAVRLNEPWEAEIIRLSALLEQASEHEQKEEFRECIKEVELLKKSVEDQQRLCEVPEIHADPKMNPDYGSEDTKEGKEEGLTKVQNRVDEKVDASGSQSWERHASQVNMCSPTGGGSDQPMKSGLDTSTTTVSTGNLPSADVIETENLWHYRDPQGKIQGPFSMMYLRKQSMSGLLPPDLRIWTNHEEYDSMLLNNALEGRFHEARKLPANRSSQSQEFEAISVNRVANCDTGVARPYESASSSRPHLVFALGTQHREKDSSGTENQIRGGNYPDNKPSHQSSGQSSQANLGFPLVDFRSNTTGSSSDFVPVAKSPDLPKHEGGIDLSRPPPTAETSVEHWEVQTAEKQQSACSDVPMQSSVVFKLPSSAPDEWFGHYPAQAKTSVGDWDAGPVSTSAVKPPKPLTDTDCALADLLTLSSSSRPIPEITSWQALNTEKIEFVDALGEDSISDLLAQADEMPQGGLPSPTSAIKFEKELIQDCKDGCFSSIEEFSRTPDPGKSEALSSSGEHIQLSCQSQANAVDPFRSSCVQSSASSEGETNGPVCHADTGSEFHPSAQNTSQDMVGTTLALGTGSETVDPGWGTVQGNINLVTVQGNVNLVLGGPGQGIPNLGFTKPGQSWANPNMNHSAPNGSLPWDNQRKIGGERFSSPRDWGYQSGDQGFGRGRPPWSRHPYGGGGAAGGYSRPLPKGQRICKFYESGHCKKGAFCDYLHP